MRSPGRSATAGDRLSSSSSIFFRLDVVPMNSRVSGCFGLANTVKVSPSSQTMPPRSITATRVQISLTTDI